MRTSRSLIHLAAVFSIGVATPLSAQTVFTVTTTADAGAGSLRQAILDANANPGADAISFNIPGVGPHSIAPVSPLPALADPVVLDAYTQPGAAVNTAPDGFDGTLLIELRGDQAGTEADGLVITAGSSTVRGLVINRFTRDGINVVGDDNVVEGNWIGTDAAGTSALPNGDDGVDLDGSGNRVGGAAPSARNVLAGNVDRGVAIGVGSTQNRIQGNFIGTNASGTAPLGNAVGVSIFGTADNSVGGTDAGARNVISGNTDVGLLIFGGASRTTVQRNYIGTDVSGTASLANSGNGVVLDEVLDITLGGVDGAGNLISGNGEDGVFIRGGGAATAVVIQGNRIGTQADGTSPLGNAGDGIDFSSSSPASDNEVGGVLEGEGNVVAFNGARGVFVSGGFRNAIRRNTIFLNGELGIDIGAPAGATPNDPGDGDVGPNNLQNYPEVASATGDGAATLTLRYTVPSATANSAYPLTIEFYVAEGDEGRRFIGADTYAAGDAEQEVTVASTPIAGVLDGDLLVATATDADGNTSEFSAPVMVSGSVVANEVPEAEPKAFGVQVWPNPTERAATIAVALSAAVEVRAEVFDLLGRRVAVLHDGPLAAGTHPLALDAAQMSAGVYVVRAVTPTATLTRRLTVVR